MSESFQGPDALLHQVGQDWYTPNLADYQHLNDGLFSILRREIARVEDVVEPEQKEALFDITPHLAVERKLERVGICRCSPQSIGILHTIIQIDAAEIDNPAKSFASAKATSRNLTVARGYNGVNGQIEDVQAQLGIVEGEVQLLWPKPKRTRMVVANTDRFRYHGEPRRHTRRIRRSPNPDEHSLQLQATLLDAAQQVLVRCSPDTYLPNQKYSA